jgi:hypothetical protein
MATSVATPVHTPASGSESPSSSTSHASETCESETDEAEEISSDLEIGRAVLAFMKQQPKCKHEDESAFLTRELDHFKSQDVLIKDSEANILAGLLYETRASISSVYRWMAMIYWQPMDGWSLIHISDNYVLNRFDNNPISRGEYRVVDSGKHGGSRTSFS